MLSVLWLEVEEERLFLVKDIEENRSDHVAVTPLKDALSVAVEEVGDDTGIGRKELFPEVLGDGTFSAARFPLDIKNAGAFRRCPRLIFLVTAEPCAGSSMLLGDLVVACVVEFEKTQTL